MIETSEIRIGENRAAELRAIVEGYAANADEVADSKAALKEKIDAAKANGFDADALKDVIKEMGLDGDKLVKIHRREHARNAYRRALGLPTTYAEAAARFGEERDE